MMLKSVSAEAGTGRIIAKKTLRTFVKASFFLVTIVATPEKSTEVWS